MTPPLVVLDTCVLAANVRRVILLSLAQEGLIRPVISDAILTELESALAHVLSHTDWSEREQEAFANQAMMWTRLTCRQVEVDKNNNDAPTLPDEADEHVLALAIEVNAGSIVTENLKDFPKQVLAPLNIEAISTDALCDQALSEADRDKVSSVLQRIKDAITWQAHTDETLMDELKRLGLKKAAKHFSDTL